MGHDSRIGAVLQGRYRILIRLAEGGMGVVYRAERLGLDRAVAIKFLHESVTANVETRRRFEVEAMAASRLSHPNCVAVIDFGVEDDVPYLVMDYIAGTSLRELLKEGKLTMTRSLAFAGQVLAGLAHAHSHGIVHRDLKPDNILVSSEGSAEHVRIIDFGLAKLKGAATITDRIAVGTPSYMSPEQTLGGRADARSDVYGAGVLLFELFTGHKPFHADNPFEVMRMHREEPVPRFADVRSDRELPPRIEAVVQKALAKDPMDRYPSAVELASALEEADALRSASMAGRLERSRSRRTLPIVLGLVAAGAAGWWVALGRTSRQSAAPPQPAAVVAADAAAVDAASEPPEIPGVAEALALAQSDPAQAVTALQRLRAKYPASGRVSFALARANVQREWWNAAVEAYAEALHKQPSYRTDPQVIHDLVQALASERASEQAATLIVGAVGDAALPELDAALAGANNLLRERAARVRARLRP